MRKIFASIVLGLAVMVAGVGVAHAEYLGQYHMPVRKTICVQDNGWKFWNDTLPNIVWRLNYYKITPAVLRDSCASYPAAQRIVITTTKSSDYFCARTKKGYYNSVSREALGVTYIEVNLASQYMIRCHHTVGQRRHVMSHEIGHALGLVHVSAWSVMNDSASSTYWKISWWTDYDYKNLRKIYTLAA